MSMNRRYSSDNPWWITQQQHQHQFMSMQSPHNPIDSSRSDHSLPSQLYHPQKASLNLSNPRDSHTASSYEHHQQTTSPSFNLNQDEDDDDDHDDSTQNPAPQEDPYKLAERPTAISEEKEPMFEKQLTPSDVGKLNRLVIPKQQAEKYFPLSGETAEHKGLVLSFEDEWGKCWRFRYSYWNSSQSYVLTKGWSRYVKEKRLNAGDIVLFERDPNDYQRLFLYCKRRRQHRESVVADVSIAADNVDIHSVSDEAGVGMTSIFYPAPAHPYPTRHHPLPNQPECVHAGRGTQVHSRTKSVGSRSSKVLRLFGVNMECQPENGSEVPTPSMSSYASAIHLQYHPQTTHEHMGHVNQRRNGRG